MPALVRCSCGAFRVLWQSSPKQAPKLSATTEEARITCAIVDAAARVRDLNFKYMSEGKGATVTARFGKDGITICDPNRASEGADKVFQKIYDRAIWGMLA